MKKQRFLLPIVMLATILITLCIGSMTAYAESDAYHELLPYMHTTTSKLKSSTVGDHEYFYYTDVPTTHLRLNENGGYTRAEYIYSSADGGRVCIEYYDKDFNVLSSKIKAIKVTLPNFGGIYYGKQYNYIFSGNGRSTSSGKWALQQFDKDWNPVNATTFAQPLVVQNAIDAGTASFTEVGNTLYIHTCYRQPFGHDGHAHQMCTVLSAKQDTLEMDEASHKMASHSFNQFAINDGKYIYYLDHGDANPRSFQIDRKPADGSSEEKYALFNRFAGAEGDNYTGAHVGGFDFAGNRIITATNTVDQSKASSFVQKNIVIYSHSKDLSEYKEVYLTNYEKWESFDENYIEVGNPFLVRTDTKYSYVMWQEVRNSDQFPVIRIAKIDEYGKLIGDIQSVCGRMSSHTPLYVDGSLVWYTTGIYKDGGSGANGAPIFYKIDLDSLYSGKFESPEFVDIATLDIRLNTQDIPYDSSYPAGSLPAVLPIVYEDKNYHLVEGLDYTVTYGENFKVGTATVTITGTGAGLNLFGGSVQLEYNIHKRNISDWKLALNPAKAVFNPRGANAKPKYSLINHKDETVSNPSGTFNCTAGTGNLWIAGTNTYAFTINMYGYEGSASADFVIEPYPADQLEVSLSADTFAYTGKEIRPSVTVRYVDQAGKVPVGETQDIASKTYQNYKVTYKNNIEVGTGTVTIEFLNNYSGKIVKKFTIKDAVEDKPVHTCKYTTITNTKKATPYSKGSITKKCSCGSTNTETIYAPSSFTLSETEYVYDGKVKQPSVTVKDSNGKLLKKGTDYTLEYTTDGKRVGKHYVKVIFMGNNYVGDKSLVFQIAAADTATLAKPANVKAASAGYNSVKVSWDKVSGATGYAIYRSTSKSGTYSLVTSTTKNSYTNSSLTTGKTYYYKVKAYKTVSGTKNYGSYSSVVSAKPVPAKPANVKAASAGYNSVKVSWDKVSGATGYAIYRSTSSSGTYSLVTSTTKNSYTNSSLTTGKTYYYKVKAYKTVSGTKNYGSYSSVVSAKPVPAKPANVKAASAGYNSVKVSWDKVSGVSGYEIYRSTSKSGTYSLVTSTTKNSYTNSSLTTGKTYYYKVKAYKTVSGTKHYGSYSSVVSAKPVPAKPANVKAASAGYNSVKLSWDKVSGVSGYEIYRSTSKSGTYSLVTKTTKLSYTNSSLTTGKTYYYKVRAYKTVNGVKNYGSYSSVVSAKPVPAKPANVKAVAAGYNSVKLSWDKVSGVSGYEVYRSTSKSGTYSLVTKTTKLSYTNSSLTTGKTYYYKVRAYKTVNGVKNYGSYSSVVSAKPIPATPSLAAKNAGSKKITLTWKKIDGATGYEVYRATSKNGTYSKVTTITKSSTVTYTNTGLTKGKTYYYKVRAYRTVSGKKVYGSYSSAKYAKG